MPAKQPSRPEAKRTRRSRAVAFRGALWITLIALLTTGIALSVQYAQTTRLLEAQMRDLLDDEASGLAERYQAGGILELTAFLQRQQQLARINEFFYLLAAPDGAALAGNLLAWPAEVDRTGFHRFAASVAAADGTVRRREVETRAVVLDGGYRLLVGQFVEERPALRRRYLSALFWSLLVTGALGLLLGWWYSRRGLAFVEKVSETGTRFLAGDLEERVPVSERGDEYDRLAATINACFVEIEHVVGNLRAATDGIAHDLKTPLTRISARLELARGEGDAAILRRVMDESRNDLDELLGIIDETLALARAEATTSASFVPIDLATIALEVVELYEPVAEQRGIVFDLRLDAAPIHGAPALIGQMVANLIDNAVKFSPDSATISVMTHAAGGAAILEVADQGRGIPAERRSDVLSRFVRLDESRHLPGSGIGLSLVSAAARVHRAELRLSDNDPGLRIVVRFPSNDAAAFT